MNNTVLNSSLEANQSGSLAPDVTLFVILWGVLSVIICYLYNRIFPKRKLINRTKGYMCDKRCYRSRDNIHKDIHIDDCCKVTYEFNIDGKKYRKSFKMFGTDPELEVDILYNKGYSDAWPENLGRINNGIYIKFLLCAFLAPFLSRIIVKFFMG